MAVKDRCFSLASCRSEGEEPALCLTFVLPLEISVEQRVLMLNIQLEAPAIEYSCVEGVWGIGILWGIDWGRMHKKKN